MTYGYIEFNLIDLQSLARVTEALSEECTKALQDHFPALEGKHSEVMGYRSEHVLGL